MSDDKKSKQTLVGDGSPGGRFLERALLPTEKNGHKINGFHPDDLGIILDSLAYQIFQNSSVEESPTFAWIARDRGIVIEFETTVEGRTYPYRKISRNKSFKNQENSENSERKNFDDSLVYVYAKQSIATEELEAWVEEKLKTFEEVNVATKTELIRQCVGNYDEEQLIEIARSFDPLSRDLKKFTERLLTRKRDREQMSNSQK